MKPEPTKALELLAAALELNTPQELDEFLTVACEGNEELRQKMRALVEVYLHGGAAPDEGSDSESGPGEDTIVASIRRTETSGTMIGRYKLLEQMGEGGMGTVWMAEQVEPVSRRVALKVIRHGMDSLNVLARFKAERQALALMDHANIAKVLDAGTTPAGRPFFVMELVKGIPITSFCDEHRLSISDRLDLFIPVCQAIQHAHQKGLIHRDIKPSNVLVALYDGKPVPKVIDFGIAKATGLQLTERTLFTELGALVGTPEYMSPEQAEMSGLDVDTRSDIYSLGVLLYQLLTGKTPFAAHQLVASGIDGMRRTIREKEPVRPSAKVAVLHREELTSTATRRSVDAAKLLHQLKGDLDWIVMKCLEKDRMRRYETANGLAADLKRHLVSEPVTARPPSTAYRFQKAVRRNKVAFVMATIVAVALVSGVIGTTIGLLRARRAEMLALRSRADAEKLSNFILEDFYAELEPSGQFETVARLARQAVSYFDSLPPSLRTRDTERNGAMARARLALATARLGDLHNARAFADEAAAKLEELRGQADQSDGTIYSLGLALEAKYWCSFAQHDVPSQAATLLKGADALRPLAISASGSRRTKLQYANLLNCLSHAQPPEQGVMTCEEALRILERMGALDLSDLSAASAWADIADSEAREALAIGRLDDAERLEKQVQRVAEGVLARRPGDLRAREGLGFSPDVLGLIEARRFNDSAALQWIEKSRRAVEDYLRFNPSDTLASEYLDDADFTIAALLFRSGRVSEALQKARAATQVSRHNNAPADVFPIVGSLWPLIARWEAQRGNRNAADEALRQARLALGEFVRRNRVPDPISETYRELTEDAERQVRLASGEHASVLSMAKDALPRLKNLRKNEHEQFTSISALLERQALAQAVWAAVKLKHFTDAESAAHTLLSLPAAPSGELSDRLFMDQPDDGAWGRVLLAQAAHEQGRHPEVLTILEPALKHYREMQAQGATHVLFRQHFARALYLQALAESAAVGRETRPQEALREAVTLLQALSDEARQLHDSKELLSWIAAAQQKLRPEAGRP